MNRCLKKILSAGFAAGLVSLAVLAQTAAPPGSLPLYFEANRGQAGPSAQFLANGRDSQFLISPTEAQIVLRHAATGPVAVRMQFVGANPQAQIRGDAELPGKINYLTGNDPAQWRTGIPIFAKIRVEEIYPGIGLIYYGNEQQLEYDFEVAPGANPDIIKIRFAGADKVEINPRGELVLSLKGGEIRQPEPVFYQTVNGTRREVSGGYRLVDAHTIGFAIGNYDHSRPLVIDPILSYSTYFGGNNGETAWSVKVDTNGFIYVAGQTFSSKFTNNVPLATAGAYQTNFHGGTLTGDAFVAKFDTTAQNLIYFTYLGGSADDLASSIAVDGQGNAFVTGFTDSPDFPTNNAIPGYGQIGGSFSKSFGSYPIDAFVAELDPSGSNLLFSTYLGGSGMDGSDGIALDSSGNIYVTGYTYSTNFPVKSPVPYHLAGTTNLYLNRLACTNTVYYNANAFIAKITLAPGSNSLAYSTYFGGNNFDVGEGIAIDNLNQVYVAGFTASTNFPNLNAFQAHLNGATNQDFAYDAFVAKFDSTGTNLLYSTYLGGTNNDVAYAIAADNNGAAYVTGWTVSTNFPNTVIISNLYNGLTNNLNFGFAVVTNAFLTKITNGAQAGIAYSTVFGGTNFCVDVGYGVAVDPAGEAFVVGATSSTNFPTFNVPLYMRATNSGKSDAFVMAFNADASGLLYSTYLGGKDNDYGYSIALDTNDNAYVVGTTDSTNFPTLNARQATRNGTNDAFLAEIISTLLLPEIMVSPTNQTVGVNSTATFSVTVTGGTPPFFYQWLAGGTNLTDGATTNGSTISGSTNATLNIFNVQTNDGGDYSVIVTNYGGSVTSFPPAILMVTNIPTILTLQPVDQTVGVGSTVTFSVDGTVQEPFFLQWLKDGTDLMDGTNLSGSIINGSTNASLTIFNVQTNDDGAYWLVVTTGWGVLASSNAVLTVLPAPLFGSIVAEGGTNGNFILSGAGGTNNGTYYVLATTNLALPLTNWTSIATDQFDSLGGFIFTNVAPTNVPHLFYILKQP